MFKYRAMNFPASASQNTLLLKTFILTRITNNSHKLGHSETYPLPTQFTKLDYDSE